MPFGDFFGRFCLVSGLLLYFWFSSLSGFGFFDCASSWFLGSGEVGWFGNLRMSLFSLILRFCSIGKVSLFS